VVSKPKITFGEMREMDVRGLLVYGSDYHCSHWVAISGDQWPDDVRLCDIEPRFTCQACGTMGADLRPNFQWEREARESRPPEAPHHEEPAMVCGPAVCIFLLRSRHGLARLIPSYAGPCLSSDRGFMFRAAVIVSAELHSSIGFNAQMEEAKCASLCSLPP
jgi:hypothetical protein